MSISGQELESFIEELSTKYKGKKGVAIPLLEDVQRRFGYIPQELLEEVSRRLRIPRAELFGVATFYAMFRLKPEGKHVIRLCRGTACHIMGSEAIGKRLESHLGVKEGDTTEDGLFTLQYVACLGCCSLAPVMMVGEDVHGKLTPEKAVKVVESYRSGGARS